MDYNKQVQLLGIDGVRRLRDFLIEHKEVAPELDAWMTKNDERLSRMRSEERIARICERVELLERRNDLTPYYFTFGWHQPHGPGAEDSKGYYTKVWARDQRRAIAMMDARYGRKWSMVYFEEEVRDKIQSHGTRLLEELIYDENSFLKPWPDADDFGRGPL